MLYTIYQVTHLESGKVYIGKHQTLNLEDGYLGSGQLIRRAVKKHGRKAFDKKILHVYETEADMNAKEAELVTEEFCLRESTYNLCPGGQGGWGYLNSNDGILLRRLSIEKWAKSGRDKRWIDISPESLKHFKDQCSDRAKKTGLGKSRHWVGKTHSADTRKQMSVLKKNKYTGDKNSQYGSMWITDGSISKKISKGELIPEGWVRGRKMS